jgi:hypothetical protein
MTSLDANDFAPAEVPNFLPKNDAFPVLSLPLGTTPSSLGVISIVMVDFAKNFAIVND